MKTSLVGTILIFVSVFGQNFPLKKANSFSKQLLPCKEDSECQRQFGPNASCNENTCRCSRGGVMIECPVNIAEVVSNAQARSFNDAEPFIGKPCETDQDCPFIYAKCDQGTKKCDCIDDYTGNQDNTFCLKYARRLGDHCIDDAQCLYKFGNSTCTSKKQCDCKENYHEALTQCWKDVGYEEPCDDRRECWHLHGHCNETRKVCVCEGNRIINYRRTLCLDVVGHKDVCFESVQCKPNLGEAECVSGYCSCSRGHHYVHMLRKCIPDKTLGQPCDEDHDCYQTMRSNDINFLICAHAKICICGNGFERIGYQCVEKDDASSAVGLYSSILFLVTLLPFLL